MGDCYFDEDLRRSWVRIMVSVIITMKWRRKKDRDIRMMERIMNMIVMVR